MTGRCRVLTRAEGPARRVWRARSAPSVAMVLVAPPAGVGQRFREQDARAPGHGKRNPGNLKVPLAVATDHSAKDNHDLHVL